MTAKPVVLTTRPTNALLARYVESYVCCFMPSVCPCPADELAPPRSARPNTRIPGSCLPHLQAHPATSSHKGVSAACFIVIVNDQSRLILP
jgi:hypothetical protein